MKKLAAYSGISLSVALTLPLILAWLMMTPLQTRFADAATSATSLGQLTGLVGTALFALALILATRLRFIESIYNGLNQVYVKHHQIAAISFILILAHPLFLVFKYVQFSTQSAAQFLLPSTYLPLTYGIIALFGMIVLLVLTFYFGLRYHVWKVIHRFLGFIFIFVVLHILTIPSDISRNFFIRDYLIVLSAIALAGFMYKSLFGKFMVRRYDYEVSAVNKLKPNVIEVALSPKGQKISFLAGQFVFVKFPGSHLGQEEHPFSISSSNKDALLTITVKMLGDYTSKIHQLSPGTKALIDGPYGRFSANLGRDKQVWIAGGIGITPFISMAKDLDDDKEVVLFYCLNNQDEMIYREEFDAIAKKPNFRVIPFYSDTSGRFSIQKMDKELRLREHSEQDFFICGPPAMMKGLKAQLIDEGVHKNNIITEEFGLL